MLEESIPWQGRTVRCSRRGTGPPVVFCHGTPWSSALWEPIADALAEDFTVHLWDMLGYGCSTMDEEQDVSLAVQGQVLADLLEHWQFEQPPHVIAHDYGGAVSLRAHLLHGARYRSLALVDAVALAPWGSEFFRLVAENAPVFARLPPPLHEALVRAYVAGAAHRPLSAAAHDMLTAPWLGERGRPPPHPARRARGADGSAAALAPRREGGLAAVHPSSHPSSSAANPARSSSTNTSGTSSDAKCPPRGSTFQ